MLELNGSWARTFLRSQISILGHGPKPLSERAENAPFHSPKSCVETHELARREAAGERVKLELILRVPLCAGPTAAIRFAAR